jgi:hypothetical protein
MLSEDVGALLAAIRALRELNGRWRSILIPQAFSATPSDTLRREFRGLPFIAARVKGISLLTYTVKFNY